jgi:hypothetical protein
MMTPESTKSSAHMRERMRLRLKFAAAVILICGLVSAAGIWIVQDRRGQDSDGDGSSPEDSRRYIHDVQVNYGQTGLLMDELTRWLKSLTHGKRLAWTIAVTSSALAGGLYFLATIYGAEHASPEVNTPDQDAAPRPD